MAVSVNSAFPTTDWHVYTPPCDVRRGINVRVMVVVVPVVSILPTVMLASLLTTLPSCIQVTFGDPGDTSTLQTREYTSPACGRPDSVIVGICISGVWVNYDYTRVKRCLFNIAELSYL